MRVCWKQGLLIALCTLVLSACCFFHQPPDRPKPVSCKAQCMAHYQICAVHCRNDCVTCTGRTKATALAANAQYVYRQRVQGLTVARQPRSFVDPLACMKFTCDCVADYQLCQQVCQQRVNPPLDTPCCLLDRSIWAW